jgi:hypothetical protein
MGCMLPLLSILLVLLIVVVGRAQDNKAAVYFYCIEESPSVVRSKHKLRIRADILSALLVLNATMGLDSVRVSRVMLL